MTLAQDSIHESVEKDAAFRLLRSSLSAPHINVETVLADAKALFGNFIDSKLLEELVYNSSAFVDSLSCDNPQQAKDQWQIPKTIDRFAKRVEATLNDYDCMEREFDMSDPSFDPEQAANVLAKCRLLVVRNVWPEELILEYKANFSTYLTNLHQGKIRRTGRTTLGEGYFHARRSTKRYDVLLPEYLKHDEIHVNKKVSKIMKNPKVLGKDFIVNSIGSVIAESGAPPGSYHYDDEYLLDVDSFQRFSVAGSDLPPWAVTMFFPLLNVTEEHGPTEFCMGTTHFKGLVPNDRSGVAKGTEFEKLSQFEVRMDSCKEESRRTPILNVGDAIFFDYTITHRGGANKSPDLRAMHYVFYSRYWYRDSNFEASEVALTYEEQRTKSTRFALVEELDDCEGLPCPDPVPLESIKNFLDPLKKVKMAVVNEDLEGAYLYLGETLLMQLKIGKSLKVELPVGAKLFLYDENDEELDYWKLTSKPRRIVLRAEDYMKA